MDIEIVSENAYARKVNVKVPASRVKAALDKAYQDVIRKARLPGFRQGKVPRHVVEARFGPGIAADVAGDLIQQGWTSVVEQHGLEPVSRPSVVEQGEVKANADFTFTIGVEVKPSVQAQQYKGLSVYWPKWEVSDEELTAALDERRQGQARLAAVTDRPVAVGDTVQVQLSAKDGDQVVLDEPGTLVRTEGESWLAGIEPLLLGLSIDEERTGEVQFSDEARSEDVRGRTLTVTAKVLAIQELRAPELDDALAQDLGHESLAALRDAVRGELAGGREEQAKNQARANLLEKLIEANPFDVPQGMVEQNLQMLVEELRMQQAYLGRDPKDVRFSQAQMADLRRRATFAARGGLLLEAVWTAEGIDATDADVEARLQEIAERRGQKIEAIRGWFDTDEAREDLRGRIREEKTLDWLLDAATVTHEAPAAEAPAPAAEAPAPAAEAPPPEKKAKKAAAAEAPPAEEAPAADAGEGKKGGAKYKTIGGVRYARELLDRAEAAGAEVGVDVVQAIVAAATGPKGISEVDKRTVAYVRDTYPLTDDAKAWLAQNADLD